MLYPKVFTIFYITHFEIFTLFSLGFLQKRLRTPFQLEHKTKENILSKQLDGQHSSLAEMHCTCTLFQILLKSENNIKDCLQNLFQSFGY